MCSMRRCQTAIVAFTLAILGANGHGQSFHPTGGPEAGRFSSFVVTHSGTLLAAATEGRVYRYVAATVRWRPATDDPQGPQYVGDLALDSLGGVWCATRSGLQRSTDDGASWTPPFASTEDASAVDVTSSGTVIALCGGRGLVRSTDGGATWSAGGEGLPAGITFRALASSPTLGLFVGGPGMVWRSTDDGLRWTSVLTFDSTSFIRAMAVAPSGAVLALAGNTQLLRCNGVTWMRADSGLPVASISSLSCVRAAVFAGAWRGAVHVTTDEGARWTALSAVGPTVTAVTAIAAAHGNLFAATDGHGVFSSTDAGVSWTPSSTGLACAEVSALTVTPPGTIVAGIYGAGIARTTDQGLSWHPANQGLTCTYVLSLACDAAGAVYAGTLCDGVFRSSDDGQRWIWITPSLGRVAVSSLAIDSRGWIFAGVVGQGIHRSTDEGTGWTRVWTDPSLRNVGALAVLPDGSLLAGADNGMALYSDDGGDTWSLSPCLAGARDPVSCLAVSTDSLFAAVGDTLCAAAFVAGVTPRWLRVSSYPVDGAITALAAERSSLSRLYVGRADAGVVEVLRESGAWFVKDPESLKVRSLALDSMNGIYAGTAASGVSVASKVVVEVDAQPIVPTTLPTLAMNYPNPFVASTTLRVRIPQAMHVRLRVHDCLGRIVAVLIDGVLKPGAHTLSWSAEGCVPGIYFGTLDAGGQHVTRAMLLVH
jgi:photosystem II stability/assembly factor-like uncharacterized protein